MVRGEVDLLAWWPGRPGAEHREELRLRTELIRRTARLVAGHGVHAPMGWRGETLTVLVPDRPAEVVRRMGHELCALGPELDRELSLGVSAPMAAISQYLVAGRQAGYAKAATRPPDAPVAVFEDLGAVQFLLEPAHGEDLDRYAQQQLGVLLAYDRDHAADLATPCAPTCAATGTCSAPPSRCPSTRRP